MTIINCRNSKRIHRQYLGYSKNYLVTNNHLARAIHFELGNGVGRILIVLNLADDLQTDMPMLQTYDARFQVDGLCSIVGIDSEISLYYFEHNPIWHKPF